MAILDAIVNISKRSMMPEWHQLDSSSTISEQQETLKQNNLKSSSRSFWFSTGLCCLNVTCIVPFTCEVNGTGNKCKPLK